MAIPKDRKFVKTQKKPWIRSTACSLFCFTCQIEYICIFHFKSEPLFTDPQIKALNPGVNPPNSNVVVVHRSDGSGTTYVWTSYVCKESPSWNQTIGTSKSVPWPTGVGASGSEGVANTLKSSANSI